MTRPVIALLTDFGTRDHYVGAMKGVMLGICPDVTLVDLSHDVAPRDVCGAALELAAAFRYFPRGTIFLAVVDPGVGTGRSAIAAETAEHRFVGPDNGVLSLALAEVSPKKVVEITERRYARPTVSRTFEGRDRFAPAAAWLARGVELTALGRPAHGLVSLEKVAPVAVPGGIEGTVVRVDRFGNLITNIDRHAFEHVAAGGALQVTVQGRAVERVVATYADAGTLQVCALFGSTDHLEIAVNGGSAAEVLGLTRGAAVRVTVC